MPKRKTKKTILCLRQDAYGEITVAEEGALRSLSFGASVLQSTIRTDRPHMLVEDYHEAMMSALLFVRQPRTVLLIGLGGCSLVHFLLRAVPECSLDIIEIREQVIDLAREYFFLPADDAKVRIYHAAGGEFLAHPSAGSPGYDIILVDAFDESGPAASLLEAEFLSACRARLNPGGVCSINLWNSPGHNFGAYYATIQDAFGNNALKLLLSESYRNAVAFGLEDAADRHNLPTYRSRAADLRGRYGINFPRFLKHLYWQNFNEQEQ